jgi:hypothetical protein
MLEAGGSRQTGSSLQLFYQLPCVQGIQEIDVTGTSVQYFNREFAFLHENSGRLLIGIAPVLKL